MPEIRAVETESTDVFTVLQNLADAEAALAARDYRRARTGFEGVLLHDPSLPTARTGLRRTLIALGRVEDAASLIDVNDSADAVLIRLLSGQLADPVLALNRVLHRDNDPRLWNALGRIYDESARPLSARQAYTRAGLAGQRAGLADNNIGQSYWLSGEMDQALLAFNRACKADPTDALFDNNRRRALVATGDFGQAVADLDAEAASVFLEQAADLATVDGETRLARLLYRKSLAFAPRYNPRVAEKLERLKQ